ncbi:mucin-2 [Wyeomyia smithii]|uniref:mucin-2 n=1 Tax=Wyeomyia smithii TaxID=174621 RepID=UPI002467D50B|nr:mucin-2 [Wyeomyia smithii]
MIYKIIVLLVLIATVQSAYNGYEYTTPGCPLNVPSTRYITEYQTRIVTATLPPQTVFRTIPGPTVTLPPKIYYSTIALPPVERTRTAYITVPPKTIAVPVVSTVIVPIPTPVYQTVTQTATVCKPTNEYLPAHAGAAQQTTAPWAQIYGNYQPQYNDIYSNICKIIVLFVLIATVQSFDGYSYTTPTCPLNIPSTRYSTEYQTRTVTSTLPPQTVSRTVPGPTVTLPPAIIYSTTTLPPVERTRTAYITTTITLPPITIPVVSTVIVATPTPVYKTITQTVSKTITNRITDTITRPVTSTQTKVVTLPPVTSTVCTPTNAYLPTYSGATRIANQPREQNYDNYQPRYNDIYP